MDWTEITVAAIGGMATIAAASLGWMRVRPRGDRRRAAARRTAADDLEALHLRRREVEMIVRRLVRDTPARRAAVFVSKNGGGVPTTSSEVRLTVPYEDHDGTMPSLSALYSDRRADREHARLVSRVFEHRHVPVVRDEMPHSDLRDIYEAHGVTHARLHLVAISEGRAVIYLSLDYSGPVRQPDAAERVAVSDAVRRLGDLMSADTGVYSMHSYGESHDGDE